ncbi:carboxymuconolactone decarboxylase family protein [Chitinophaga sp. 22321]|uniref:Carboxymuconolactone decarboxylase family protein n=1 Tax=Chitinophaga hostae TaxID=2831022 RepID=A0ABS5J7L4_9BACT|nr:carboxymuconolactone decarboxylase family protein [Chitinophaga hostae]MBS0031204.1 carboxymuconolactone decarboxylase family protein [Chitinophaga hostae]
MTERFLMKEIEPGAYKAMLGLEAYLSSTGISPLHHEMIRVRASQINGCAYCIDAHTKDARKHGETEQRLYLLNAWRESPQFTDEERIILAITEEVTHISRQGLTEATYQEALQQLGMKRTAEVIMAVNIINAWNRIGISTHRIPGK